MGKKLTSEAKSAILATCSPSKLSRDMSNILREKGLNVSHTAINELRKKACGSVIVPQNPPKNLPNQCLPSARVKSLVTKVKKSIKRCDPPSQRELSRKYGVSVGTINRIIHD